MKLRKIFVTLLIISAVTFIFPLSCTAASFDLSGYDGIGIYAVETNSGEVLVEQNAHEKMYPGSITKVMTVIVTLDACENLSEKVTITDEMLDMLGYNSSTADLKVGEELTVEDLIYAALIPSGNDAAIALAVHSGEKMLETGQQTKECYDAFIKAMNEKAAKIGMSESHFANADGYDDYNNYSTAYDIFLLGREAVKSEIITKAASQKQINVTTNLAEHEWDSTNLFYYSELPYFYGGGENPYYCSYITGMKTGYTDIGQKCLLFTAGAENKNIIGAILNVNDDDYTNIWSKTYSILDYIINKHTLTELVTDDNRHSVISISNPAFLKPANLDIYASSNGLTCLDNDYLNSLNSRIVVAADKCELKENGKIRLKKDIKAGDKVASLIFYSGNTDIHSVDMIAIENYNKFGLFDLLLYIVLICAILLIISVIYININKHGKKKYVRKGL